MSEMPFGAALVLAAALAAAPLAAQEGQAGPPPARPDTVQAELVFEREVFQYPGFQRRNPFRVLVGNLAGPRFEQIELKGIIYSQNPRESVALLSLRGQARQALLADVQQQEQAQSAGAAAAADTIVIYEPAQRLRVGESWGNVTILQIQRDHVVLQVEEFGMTDQRILRMPTRRLGGL